MIPKANPVPGAHMQGQISGDSNKKAQSHHPSKNQDDEDFNEEDVEDEDDDVEYDG